MSAHVRSNFRRFIAGASAALLLAAGLTVVTEAVAPAPAVAAQNPTQCAGSVSLDNGSFEQPAFSGGFIILPESSVPGWLTTATDGQIELWRSPGNPRAYPAGQGSQFAELNANQASMLYQDVATTPGQTLYWSLKHRGRQGNDTMRVMIGVPGGTLTNVSGSITDGTAAWGTHSGSYTVPAGQTLTRFGFQAVSTSTGNATVGNLLDDITFGTGPCLISDKTVQNLTRGGTTAEIGDTLRYTVTTRNGGGNPALQSVSTDVLPAGIDFVPGSIRIVSGPGAGALTDAAADDRGEYVSASRTLRVRLGDAATTTLGGSVGVDAVTSYTFDAKVRTQAAGTTIVNEASVAYREPVTSLARTSTTQEGITPVNQAADLAIVKTLTTSPLVAGQSATFAISVTNNGPQAATGVTVNDPVPAGLTNVQATPSGGNCTVGAAITCALPNLAVGATATISVTGTLAASFDPGAALTNTASVAGTLFDPNLANNTATASDTLTANADVSVTKTFSPADPDAGALVTYTLTTHNDGPSEARDVRIADPLDPETTFISATSPQGTCAFDAGIVDCALGTLAVGATVTTTIVVRIAAGASGVVQNSVNVTSSTPDPDPSNNVDSTSFEPDIIADLAVVKTASVSQAAAGSTVDFTLAVSNEDGGADAVNVVLDDTVPAGFTVTGVTGPAGADCAFDASAVRCTWGDFPAGGPAVDVVVRTVVDADAPAGTVTNTASVASPAQDDVPTNNSDSADVEIVQSADVRVQKTAPATGTPGSPFTYTLVVTNDGPSTARGVTVADTLPVGFTVTSVDDADCTNATGTVSCALGDLAPGGSTTILIAGTWSPTAIGAISNTATTASATPDPTPANNTSTAVVTLSPSADVTIAKTTSTPGVPLGGQANFLITVTNDGPSAAAAVVVSEVAGAGLAVTEATPSTGTWSQGDQRWTVGTLLPGQSATLAVTAAANAEGVRTNTATVSSPTPDPDPLDNTSTTTVTVTPIADVSIVKTASADPAPLNGPLTYTLTVTNSGPSVATGVMVSDALPAGLLAPTTTTAGCTMSTGTLVCTRATLAVGATFTATVSGTVTPSFAGILTNTATVSSTTPDPDPSNNTSTVGVPVTGTPRVELLKVAAAPVDANGSGRIDAGDTVAYTFTVRNIGDVTFTSAAITDTLLGGAVACSALTVPLAPGAELACAPVEYTLTQADVDAGNVHNEASVEATTSQGPATDEAEADATVPAVASITLTKTPSAVVDVDQNEIADAGDTIDYTFTVTNTGTVTLTDAEIDDAMLGGAVDCPALDGAELAPGDSVSCAPVTYTLVQGDIDDGVVQNTATLTAEAPDGQAVTDDASASADIVQTAGIELVKSAGVVVDVNGDGFIGAGDTLEYGFTVRNSAGTTLTDLIVSDPLLGGTVCTIPSLAGEAETTCGPVTYALTQADIEAGHRDNTATAEGTSPISEEPVTDSSSTDVTYAGTAAIALEKQAAEPADTNDDGMIGAGDTVDYTFTIVNTGTTVLADIVLDDPLLGGILTCAALDGLSLVPGDDVVCGPAAYELTQADVDAGLVVNDAQVQAQAPAVEGVVEDDDTAEVAVNGTGAVTLEKLAGDVVDANENGITDAGDTVDYSFTVENSGTTTLTSLVLVDPLLGGELTCDGLDGEELAPGDSVECGPVVYLLTQADIDAGDVENTATVTGEDPSGPVTDSSSTQTDIDQTAGVELVKTAGDPVDVNGDGFVGAGDTISYALTVRNTGGTTLSDVTVTDLLLGGEVCTFDELGGGAEAECGPFLYTLTQTDVEAGERSNTADVVGNSPLGPRDDEADALVEFQGTPQIALIKTAGVPTDATGDDRIGAGDTIAYSFEIRNTGTLVLSDIVLDDPLLGGAIDCAALDGLALAPQGTVACGPVTYTLTQDDLDAGTVSNDAGVSAESVGGAVDDDASADVSVPAAAGVTLLKSASTVADSQPNDITDAGDTIEYTFTVVNTGMVTLSGLELVDEMLGGDVLCDALDGITLAPGDEVTCDPVTYTLEQGDIDGGVVTNLATVSGDSPVGGVSDDASVTSNIDQTAGIQLTKTAGVVVDANGDGQIGAGDTVDYRFTVRNTAGTSLTNVRVSDPLLDGEVCAFEALAGGEAAECGPITYVLTQDDIEAASRTNTATASGTSPLGPVDNSSTVVIGYQGTPAVELVKEAGEATDTSGDGMIGAGDTIEYSFTIRNTGTTVLREIVLDDPLLGGAVDCPVLADLELVPGADAVVCGVVAYAITQADVDAGTVSNEATVTAQSVAGPATATDDANVAVVGTDALTLLKSAAAIVDANGNGRTDAGDTIAYTFTVTNTGTTTLTGIAVLDPRLDGDIVCDVTELAPGIPTVCAGPDAILTQAEIDAGEIVNAATATGTGTGDEPPTAETTIVTPIEAQPAIALAKTGGDYVDANGNNRMDAGDTVAFRFTVTNTGAVTLTDLVIDDPQLGGILDCALPDIAPDGVAACGPILYTLTAADVAKGEVVNVATVSGAANGLVVTAAATATVDIEALAVTGGVVAGLGWAIALLIIGALILLITRMRRRDAQA